MVRRITGNIKRGFLEQLLEGITVEKVLSDYISITKNPEGYIGPSLRGTPEGNRQLTQLRVRYKDNMDNLVRFYLGLMDGVTPDDINGYINDELYLSEPRSLMFMSRAIGREITTRLTDNDKATIGTVLVDRLLVQNNYLAPQQAQQQGP